MAFTDSKNRTTPNNWIIQTNDGTNVVAVNTITKETYNGTLSGFNTLLNQTNPTFDVANANPVVLVDPTTGIPYAASGGSGGSTIDRELVTTVYKVKTAFTGASVGDFVTSTQIYDVTSTASLVSTIWFNQTTNLVLATAPNTSNLESVTTNGLTDAQLRASAVSVSGPLTDTQLRASAVPVSGPLTDTQLRAAPLSVTGALTDTQLRASAILVNPNLSKDKGNVDGNTLRIIESSPSSVTILNAATNAVGTNWSAFGSQACQALDIVNDTGTAIEYRRGGTGSAMRIPSGSARLLLGLSNANQVEIKRVDSANTQVTVQAEAFAF